MTTNAQKRIILLIAMVVLFVGVIYVGETFLTRKNAVLLSGVICLLLAAIDTMVERPSYNSRHSDE
jgi:hypothetical protein